MKSTQTSFNTKSNIEVAKFIVMEDTVGLVGHNTVRQASDGALPIVGISAQWPDDPQLPEVNTALGGAAVAYAAQGTATNPKSVSHYPENTQAPMRLGANVVPGDVLTSDANGDAVVAAAGQWFGAVAYQPGSAGDLIDVEVRFGKAS